MRSAIPKVMGILMIIFASFGLFGSAISMLIGSTGAAFGPGMEFIKDSSEYKLMLRVDIIFGVIGLVVSAVHLLAGLRAVAYKANAPKLALVYAALGTLKAISYGVIMYAWLKPALEKMIQTQQQHMAEVTGHKPLFDASGIIGVSVIAGVVIGVAWPVIVSVLMTRPAAKSACTN